MTGARLPVSHATPGDGLKLWPGVYGCLGANWRTAENARAHHRAKGYCIVLRVYSAGLPNISTVLTIMRTTISSPMVELIIK